MTMPTRFRAMSPHTFFSPVAVILAAALFLFAGFALAEPGPDPDRYIVQFAERGNSDAARQAIARAGGQVLLELERVNAAAARIPAQALQGLRNNPNIKLIEHDAPRYPMAQTVPYGISMVQADLVPGGVNPADIKVCIIDSGLDRAHEDLSTGNLAGTNVSGSGNWYEDTCGHGSHVAGTIMAQDNTLGVVGVTPNVGLHIIKVFDGEGCGWAYASSLVDAAYACGAAGADIINMSLGCSSSRGGPWSCASSTEDAAFQDLNDNFGVLSIAAAGNDGSTNSSYPASYASVVSVAAVDSAKVVASFSQQNSAVELAGPGVAVRSTVPMGSGKEESLSVGGTGYEAIAMAGSPDITATGELVDCGLGTSTCSDASRAVCLIQRGEISFADKVLACQDGGGVAAVIYNNEPGLFSGTVENAGTTIPSVSISGDDGAAVKGALGASATVAVAPGNYAYFDGTSMATPHVAGVAALVWGQDPTWTNTEVRQALQATAQDLGAAGRDNAYGYGLVQAQAAVDYLGGGGDGGGDPDPNSPPMASFTFDCTDLGCDFDASGSSDSDGDITSYAWDFGDGNTATGMTSTHAYDTAGEYTVTLTVTDNAGDSDSTSQPVTVSAPGDGGGDAAPISLTATGYKVQGRHRIDLVWEGATSSNVDIYRDGGIIATTTNDGAYTDATNNRGGATYSYQVCEAGTTTCSDTVTVVF